MFTDTEIDKIEMLRGQNTKLAYNTLADIYLKYTGIKAKGCGCKSAQRLVFFDMFYEWYEQETN